MATYVKRSCPQCKNVLEPRGPLYFSFGLPFVQCSKCGILLNRQEHINEWFLMDWFKKLVWSLKGVVSAGVLGYGGPLILLILLSVFLDGKNVNMEKIPLGIWMLVRGVGSGIFIEEIVLYFWRMRQDRYRARTSSSGSRSGSSSNRSPLPRGHRSFQARVVRHTQPNKGLQATPYSLVSLLGDVGESPSRVMWTR